MKCRVESRILGQEGDTAHLKLKLNTEKHLLVTGGIYLRLAIINEMIGDTDYKSVFLPLAGRRQEYDIPLILKCCGRIQICCEEMKVQDVLQLFVKNVVSVRTEWNRISKDGESACGNGGYCDWITER